jgi:hypothetical protein
MYPRSDESTVKIFTNFSVSGSLAPVLELAITLLLCLGLSGVAGFRKKFKK